MSASEREGGRKRSGASPASARRRLRARTGPCLTAKTPDFGLGSSITVATSPAANISGRDRDCSVSLTARKPRASGGEPALRDPRRGVRSGCPYRGLSLEAPAAIELDPVFAGGNDLSAEVHRDAASAEDASDTAARAVSGEDGQLAEQRELRGGSGESVPHGEQHLDPGRAAADHGDAPHLAPPRPLAQPFPAREKRLDRADTERVFCGGGRIAGARPGVEGQDVVAKTLAPGGGHLAPRGIDAGRGVQ